jgi:hypothetical protein
MVETSRICGVHSSDARFLARCLRDAEELSWGNGQLEQRKRVVELAMTKQTTNAREEESSLYGLRNNDLRSKQQSAVFQRHGWNKIDSGFRLWGAGKKNHNQAAVSDHFLMSKGWNEMDSGFRII